MSWCDKLASTPGVGFKLDAHYAPSDIIINSLTPILDKFHVGEKTTFGLDRLEAFAVSISTEQGFVYNIEPSNANVAFRHRMRAKPVSAGLPVMEMLSEARPYTELLPQATSRLIDVTLRLPKPQDRFLRRIGVVAQTTIAEEEMPPGIAKLAQYIGRPWAGKVDSYNIQIVAQLDEKPAHVDRCVFQLSKSEDKQQLNSFVFDWQRSYAKGQSIDRKSLDELTKSVSTSALEYFEQIAEGNEWDEGIISGAPER